MAQFSLPYSFYGGNRRAMLCRDAETILAGCADSGKTLSLLAKLHLCAGKYPGAQISIIRKVKKDLYGAALLTWKRDILDTCAPFVTHYGGENPQWYDYPNGSRIWLGGLDDPGKTLSSERDIVYVNQAEELTLADWEYLTRVTTGRGARMPYTQLIGDANPAGPLHWILQRRDAGKLTFFESFHKDNPSIFNPETGEIIPGSEGRITRLQNLTGVRYKRLYQGLWAAPEGVIYDIYDDDRHKVKAFPIPRLWPRVVGIDPMGAEVAALWMAFDPKDKCLHAYREYMEPFGVTSSQHVRNILHIVERNKETILAFVGGGPSERQPRTDWVGYGLPLIEPPFYNVWAGIDRVYNLLSDGKLKIHDCCVNLIGEIGQYRRVQNKRTGEFSDTIFNKNAYHCLVGDTLVTTDEGDVPIQDIRAGHQVLTRKGYRRVRASACTSPTAKVYDVHLSNGRMLTGTAEHPVWVDGQGYTDLCALRCGDILLAREEVSSWRERQSYTQGERGDGIPILQGEQIGATTQRPSTRNVLSCTGTFGKSTTGPSQRGLSYITSMGIPATTMCQTSSCLLQRSTSRSTGHRSEASRLGSMQRESDHWQQHGTAPQKVSPGTRSMARKCGRGGDTFGCGVSSAEHSSRQEHSMGTRDSARMRASPLGGGPVASMMRSESVSAAGSHSPATSTARPDSAPVYVLRVTELASREPVYNLEVEGEHEFFANGVLVHNCLDCARYAIAWLSGGDAPTQVVYRPERIGVQY